jgi:hypothetical protein
VQPKGANQYCSIKDGRMAELLNDRWSASPTRSAAIGHRNLAGVQFGAAIVILS